MSFKSFILNNQFVSKIVYRYINNRIANRQYRENRELLSKLKCLKGSQVGKRCFIIGTGPSLTVKDLNLLKGEVTFATNRIYELFDKTDWRPTYYVNQDHTLIKTFRDKIKAVDVDLKFLPIDYKDIFEGDSYRFFVLKHKEFYPDPAPFSYDIVKYLAQGFTVTYGAIQIAIYMGFTEIYLLGIDHNYNITRDAQGNPVRSAENSDNYPKGMPDYLNMANLPRVEETTIAYDTAEVISRKLGIRIYNCTRGGKLEAFERKNLETVIN